MVLGTLGVIMDGLIANYFFFVQIFHFSLVATMWMVFNKLNVSLKSGLVQPKHIPEVSYFSSWNKIYFVLLENYNFCFFFLKGGGSPFWMYQTVTPNEPISVPCHFYVHCFWRELSMLLDNSYRRRLELQADLFRRNNILDQNHCWANSTCKCQLEGICLDTYNLHSHSSKYYFNVCCP